MTTLNAARAAIYAAFVAGWSSTSAYTFDNETYEPPAGVVWARVSIRHNARQQESLGASGTRKFESGGVVFMQCFAPLDSGASSADTLAQVAQGIFEGTTLTPENIRFTSSSIREAGPTDDWYMIVVEAAFTYTTTK